MVKLSLAFVSLILVLEHEFNFNSIVFSLICQKINPTYWSIDSRDGKVQSQGFWFDADLLEPEG